MTIRSRQKIDLNQRAQHLLRVLIERYISDGQPIGSRTLSRDSGLDLSAATVRNVMADLEELGFLRSPHTSAGRVPTVHGYRFFVDSLLRLEPLDNQEIADLKSGLNAESDTSTLMQSVSSMLSSFTHMAGVVTLPRRNVLTLRHVEFLGLSNRRVLAILVINEEEVQNRILYVQRDYSEAELQQVTNYLNDKLVGSDVHRARERLLKEMEADRASMNDLMETVIEMADKTFELEDADKDDYVLEGETNLIGVAELSDMDKLRQLFDAFDRKRDILHLLDQCMKAQGIQIVIGEESGYDVLDECSLVTAPYAVDGKTLGVLGVIGPTRMAYERVIPIVDVTAKLLASTLNSRN